ncbi:MAG TPA: hypothetical protein VFI54_09335 [Solirubrobacteraceae bacterium]|nr:hypothetical protein [Solirubrobacteraceae bacterium]
MAPDDDPQDEFAFDVERMVARGQGREAWWREGRRQLEQRRGQTSDPVPRSSREDRLLLAAQRLEDERDARIAANQAYEEYRATGRDTQGHRLGTRANPWTAPDVPDGVVSVSDPDSQRMKSEISTESLGVDPQRHHPAPLVPRIWAAACESPRRARRSQAS